MTIEQMHAQAYERGVRDGERQATSIGLPESSYGASQWAVVAVEFKSLRELINHIKERQWRRHGDNPGQAYMGTAKLIHIHNGDYAKVAMLKCAVHYDI